MYFKGSGKRNRVGRKKSRSKKKGDDYVDEIPGQSRTKKMARKSGVKSDVQSNGVSSIEDEDEEFDLEDQVLDQGCQTVETCVARWSRPKAIQIIF